MATGAGAGLSGVIFLERDYDDELLSVWVYPKIDVELKSLVTSKCQSLSKEHSNASFCYSHFSETWYYIYKSDIKDLGIKDRVTEIFCIVLALHFNPELYESFCKLLTKSYFQSTSDALAQYMSLYTKNYCVKDDNTKFLLTDFDVKKAYLNTCVKELIQLFGMETILIYNGLLLKKRIVVCSPKLSTLFHICRTLPALVFHRLNWNIVYPMLNVDEEELKALQAHRTYVAGFTDASIENRTDAYDILLNVTEGEVVINPQSKEFFQMGKMHKEIANYLVQATQDEDVCDEDIIRELTRKTKDIISNLKSLDQSNPDHPKISLELLQERKMTSAMQTFLYHLASAEGIVRL